MIVFKNKLDQQPYNKFYNLYEKALSAQQISIEAACLSTVCSKNKPHSRYINIKYIDSKDFIFFSNFNSNKAKEIQNNSSVAINFFWNTIGIQIRIEGEISKVEDSYSDKHWHRRKKEKNALSISSDQSSPIGSYHDVKLMFDNVMTNQSELIRPSYWGGYSISPHSFEFWQGHKNRINKRELYTLESGIYQKSILQP